MRTCCQNQISSQKNANWSSFSKYFSLKMYIKVQLENILTPRNLHWNFFQFILSVIQCELVSNIEILVLAPLLFIMFTNHITFRIVSWRPQNALYRFLRWSPYKLYSAEIDTLTISTVSIVSTLQLWHP